MGDGGLAYGKSECSLIWISHDNTSNVIVILLPRGSLIMGGNVAPKRQATARTVKTVASLFVLEEPIRLQGFLLASGQGISAIYDQVRAGHVRTAVSGEEDVCLAETLAGRRVFP